MTRRGVFTMLAIIFATVCLIGVPGDASAKAIEIKVGSAEPEGHYLVQCVFLPWCKEVERRTNGKVKFKWYHSGSLLKYEQNFDAARDGLVQMVPTVAVFTQEARFPVSSVFHLPFLFETTLQANLTLEEAYRAIPEIREEFKGLKMFGFHCSDITNFALVRGHQPPKTLEDLKGLKIWAPSKKAVEIVKLLDASPRMVKMEDLYMSLQRKSLDGVLFPTGPLAKWKLTDVCDVHSMVYMSTSLIPAAMNLAFYNSLPAEVREVVEDMGPSWTKFAGAIVDNRREDTIKKLKNRGDKMYAFPSGERDRLRKQMQPVWEAWLQTMKDRGIDGQVILDKVLALAEKYRNPAYQPDSWWPADWKK